MRPLSSWNLCTKYCLKYSILGNWVMKWLLYLCLILLWFRYLDGLPKTYFRKVEFNCKVQLPTSDLFLCPKCTSCPYVWLGSTRRPSWVIQAKKENKNETHIHVLNRWKSSKTAIKIHGNLKGGGGVAL